MNFSAAMAAWAAACYPESRQVAKLSICSSAVCKLMSVASKRKAVKDDNSDAEKVFLILWLMHTLFGPYTYLMETYKI